ncbi:MAG: SEC-C metal-binding domain-containing protein, partial [Atribacterota bacterium]|nr:SEC-C metal-binding domain-containing protein [Atribacterota bacterium]
KQLLEFDNEMEYQRRIIYEQRKTVLFSSNVKNIIVDMLEDTIKGMLQRYTNKEVFPEEWNLTALKDHFYDTFGINIDFTEDITRLTVEKLENDLLKEAQIAYQKKENEVSTAIMRQIEKMILLRIVDREWKDHLKRLDDLKQGIGLRAYGQKDPLTEYHFEAHNMFQNMVENIKEDSIKYIYRVKIQQAPSKNINQTSNTNDFQNSQERPNLKTQKTKTDFINSKKKIGRNDPCTCGSGKKYKHCCGKKK